MKIALIEETTVSRIETVSSEEEIQGFMQTHPVVVLIDDYDPQPQVGWIWNGSILSDPMSSTQSRKITRLGLRNRFTFPELIALTTAAKTNVAVEVLIANLSSSSFVDLSRADTVGGMNVLVAYGIVTSERASEILNNPITDLEKYRGQ